MLAALAVPVVKKGIVMEIHDEKNHLYNIIIFFSMLLFAVCLTMNVIFGSNYYPYESLDNTIIYKTWTISNNITVIMLLIPSLYF